MKDSVNKYISLLLKDTEDYSIDVNFNFQFMTEGGLKGIDSYSRGYQNIISLCMRLALIDCLYPQEKPFIILDDPFVNFDDEKLELCKALIRTISKQYQIVYFACHKSREIHVKAEDKKTIPDAVTRPIFQKPTPIRASVKEMLGSDVLKDEPKKPINVERPKRLSIEDELLEDLTRVKPQDVRPAQVRKIDATTIKKDVPQATPKTQKTIVIKRGEPESDEPKVKPRTIKINK